jgi:hypothetical protein
MTEHSINRSGATANSQDEQPDVDESETDSEDTADEDRSEAEIKRELRESVVGQAILQRNRELERRQRRRR